MKLTVLSTIGLLVLASCKDDDRIRTPTATGAESSSVLRMNIDDDLAFLEIAMSGPQGDHDYPCVELTLRDQCGLNYQVDRPHDLCRARIIDARVIDFGALEQGLHECGRELTGVRMQVRSSVEGGSVVVAQTGQVFQALDPAKHEASEDIRTYQVVPNPDWKHVGLRSAN